VNSTISTKGLGLTIGGAIILKDISLEAKPGEILGIIGPNGAGKTSLFNLLSGLRAATSGAIFLGERDITSLAPHLRAQAGLARTFQTSSVFPNLTLLENVRLAVESARGESFNVFRKASKNQAALESAEKCLAQAGLADKPYAIARNLSHGDKRRLEIAIVLASEASVVMLDEPMAGMSVENIPALVELIRSLSTVYGKTVLLVEHHLDVVLGLADRVAVLNYGELLICDTPEKVIADPTVQSAYIGAEL
jgi:branched-chain amino acid transport system ATP-binding protein